MELATSIQCELALAVLASMVVAQAVWSFLLLRRTRRLTAFAERVGVDLQNSLASFKGIAQRLRRSVTASQEVEALARKLETDVDRAARYLEKLALYSSASKAAGGPSGTSSTLRVLEKVLQELQPLTSEHGVSLHCDVGEVRVAMPPPLLHAVLFNAVENAARALEGRRTRKVEICAKREGSWCELTVQDTGRGIAASHRRNLFQPSFERSGRGASNPMDAGPRLGLATVMKLVSAYGGRVSVESQVGKGTRLTLRLPLDAKDRPARLGPERIHGVRIWNLDESAGRLSLWRRHNNRGIAVDCPGASPTRQRTR